MIPPIPPTEAEQPDDDIQLVDAPATIHVKDVPQSPFIVDTVGGWGYTPQGIFATGHWRGWTDERDVLIPYVNVIYIEFHFNKLAQYLAAEAQAQRDATNVVEMPVDDEPQAEAA